MLRIHRLMFVLVVGVVLAAIFVMRRRERATWRERAVAPTPQPLPLPPSSTAAPASPPVAGDTPPSDEQRAMRRLRDLVRANPDAALALARDLARRYPHSARAEEREVLVIDALVGKGDVGQARANAEEFLERHPTGAGAAHIERLTGVHPHAPIGE